MSNPTAVEDVYPVLRQWSFVAYEAAVSMDSAVSCFFEARSTLNAWRQSVPASTWTKGDAPADLNYEVSMFRMQGASYFLICAARQLVRVLDADPTLGRLPGDLHRQVHQLRNVVEHWDEWTKDEVKRGKKAVLTSAARLRNINPNVWPFGFKFTSEMDYLVGDTISFAHLRQVLTDLWLWQQSTNSPDGCVSSPSPLTHDDIS